MRTNMQKNFAEIPSTKLPRSKFDRSFDLKTTFDAGYLVPIMVDELIPGDRVELNASAILRLNTPIFPIMDNLYMDMHFFAVPCRLLWDNWQNFMGERPDPDSTIDQYTIPTLARTNATDFGTGTIFDYMGLPPDCDTAIRPSALPFRAYNLIWNEWYRDQNLQDRVTFVTNDSVDGRANYNLLRRNKRHDYFTSCLPWPQRTSAVEIPLVGSAPVTGIGVASATFPLGPISARETDGTGIVSYAGAKDPNDPTAVDASVLIEEDPNNIGFPNIRTDLTSASGITINDLRDHITMQQFAELDARGGTRYTEIIKAHFDVESSDARLQRPELLGKISHHVSVQAVQVTGGAAMSRPVGDLGATAYSTLGNEHGFTYAAEEHCYIIGLASVRSDLTYSQGVDKLYTRRIREDFYWPTFANLGEQPVAVSEISAEPGGSVSTDTFGYQERYAEYRSKRSQITGLFRVDAANSLAAWHLSQDLPVNVALNSDFIEEDPPIDRIVSVPSEPDFRANFYFEYHCERQIPQFGIPGIARI